MTANLGRPDPANVLKGLKDFQRDTVAYVFGRMYVDRDPTHRFLVADEAGLGKTMVARGLIARVIDHLWDKVKRIDIVYICSNADIARQNVRKLNVTGKEDAAITSRITLLPTQIQDLAGSRVNLVSFTPSTSLELKSNLGTAEERALLYWMLKREWGLHGAAPKNLLQGYAGAENFRERLAWFNEWYTIDKALLEAFHTALTTHVDIKPRFLAACEIFDRSRKYVEDDARDAQRQVVGELRAILAATCVRALQPDLIILDEFQRFKHLLEGGHDASLLARELFTYSDSESKARVLLLSATPYKMYTMSDEAADDDHYVDFLRTARFLLNDAAKAGELDGLLRQYRTELFRLGSSDGTLGLIKDKLEGMLRRVMVRTERLATTKDRDGMLVDASRSNTEFTKQDPLTYRGLHRVAMAVDHGDPLEYWKAAPYVLNFMDEYKLKEAFEKTAKDESKKGSLADALAVAHPLLLPWDDIESYRAIDPANARLRWLLQEVIARGLWKLLWVPPSAPYYRLAGPYADPTLRAFTKRLVFSAWRVVPKVIAALVSYEAERRMILSGPSDQPAENTVEARKKRRGLLQFTRSEGRLTGMPVLGLLYPSVVLARNYDPVVLAASRGGGADNATLDAVLREATLRLEKKLGSLTAKAKTTGPDDEKWYWAAPILLDRREESDATTKWFAAADLAKRWGGEDRADDEEQVVDGQRSPWEDHVQEAKFAASGVSSLGRPPADLAAVLAQVAVGGPAVVALRALSRVAGGDAAMDDTTVRHAAGRIAWAVRNLFNLPEATALVRGLNPAEPYWLRVLEYCLNGCLQAVLDEYVHVLRDSQGLQGRPTPEMATTMADDVCEAIGLRTALLGVDQIKVVGTDRDIVTTEHRMRARFAARLSEETTETGGEPTRADQVRKAFNSPFWPFVLATTSVGQEGLDFHQYCHAVVHWNLPSNPVDLEQREGRVHRYKGHAVRKNVASRHYAAVGKTDTSALWDGLFNAAVAERGPEESDLVPYWVYPTPDGARIERHVPAFPLSREVGQLEALKRSLAVYRMVFGQPRQEDLMSYLLLHVPAEQMQINFAKLRIDLTPPRSEAP